MTDLTVHTLWVPGVDPLRDEIVARQQATPGVTVCLHTDPTRRGCMANWLTAVACVMRSEPQPWEVILSDDADPASPTWVEEMRSACEHAPARVLGLTHFGGFGERTLAKGTPYAVGRYWVWGGAIAYRRDFFEEMARWAMPVAQRTGYKHDDALVEAFALRNDEPTALAARAIFDQPVKTSLLGHNTPIRSPNTTIRDAGPPWDHEPRSTRMSRQIDDEIRMMAREEP